jgi:hypothetical protein
VDHAFAAAMIGSIPETPNAVNGNPVPSASYDEASAGALEVLRKQERV